MRSEPGLRRVDEFALAVELAADFECSTCEPVAQLLLMLTLQLFSQPCNLNRLANLFAAVFERKGKKPISRSREQPADWTGSEVQRARTLKPLRRVGNSEGMQSAATAACSPWLFMASLPDRRWQRARGKSAAANTLELLFGHVGD